MADDTRCGQGEDKEDKEDKKDACKEEQTGLGAGSTRASYNFKVLPFVVTRPREQQNDERNETD